MFERMGDAAPPPALYGNDYHKVTLKMMLDYNINEFTNDFEELSTAAAKQHGLKKAIGKSEAVCSKATEYCRVALAFHSCLKGHGQHEDRVAASRVRDS